MTKNLVEGWYNVKPIDKERYQERDGLEGPFQTKAGKVVYYDPREGSYYDPDTDMYLSYEEWRELNENRVYTVEYTSLAGNTVPMLHKTFEVFSEAVAFGKAGVAGGSYKSFEIYEEEKVEEAMTPAHKKLAHDVHKQLKRDEPMAGGPGMTLKANHKMLRDKYGADWKKKAGIEEARTVKLSKKDTVIGQFSGARGAKLIARRNGAYYDLFVYNEYDSTGVVVARGVSATGINKVLDADWFKQTVRKAGGLVPDTAAIQGLAGVSEAAYEKDMDDSKPVVVSGVKGVKSTPFKKKFRNMDAYSKWSDSDAASDYEVHHVVNEAPTEEVDENLGKAMKKFKRWYGTDPRDVKDRIKKADPEFRDTIKKNQDKLGGAAELQRRLARKMESAISEGLSDDAHHMERDHEVQMARSDLYKTANYAIKLHSLLKGVSEAEGIEGWMQAKITKAADYLSSVFHALEYDKIEQAAPVMPAMESVEAVTEEMKLDRKTFIIPQRGAEQFAKHYRAGMIGQYRPGGPTEKDDANSEKFHTLYSSKDTRSGFAGSGTTIYTNNKTGEQFEVDRYPNGKGFHGTDHSIKVVASNVGESDEGGEDLDGMTHSISSLQHYFGSAVAGHAAHIQPAMMSTRKAIDGKYYDLIDTPKGYVSKAREPMGEAVAKIACVKCDEVSTAAAWKKNNGFCPKCKTSSQGVAESAINEGYADRVQQVADRVNKAYSDGLTRNEMAKIIAHYAYDQVEMRGSEKAKRDFIKDIAAKVNVKRDTAKSDANRATKEKILQYLATAIEDAVGNSVPDGDPWDWIEPKGRKLGIDPDDLLQYLDLAARKHLGAKGYHAYLKSIWDAYGAGDLGMEPPAGYRNPWGESIEETTSAGGVAAVVMPMGKMIKRKKK